MNVEDKALLCVVTGGLIDLIDFIAKKKTMVVGNAQRITAQKVVPISVS